MGSAPGETKDDVMIAIVSLLDTLHEEMVKSLWRDLESRFDLKIPYSDPLAHLSFQVFDDVDVSSLIVDLQEWTGARESFRVLTSGLGIFPGSRPVLYLPVVRGPILHQLHQHMYEWLTWRGYTPRRLYGPQFWIPHITLVIGEQGRSNLQEVIHYLCERPLQWEIEINNISIISGTRSLMPSLEYTMPLVEK